MFWILPLPLPWPFQHPGPSSSDPCGELPYILVFWWKALMLLLSVSRVCHLVPGCPEVVSTRHGWRHEGLGSCPLLLVSPKTPPVSTGGFPSFTLGKIWPYALSFPWGHIPQRLDLIFVADGLQVGETNFLPRRKVQFDISSYHPLNLGLLNKYKCKTPSHGWSWSHGK